MLSQSGLLFVAGFNYMAGSGGRWGDGWFGYTLWGAFSSTMIVLYSYVSHAAGRVLHTAL